MTVHTQQENHMSTLETASARLRPAGTAQPRIVLRWLVSFAGFPLGGLAAWTFGPVDDPASAAVGGLVTGVVLGAVQAWALGRALPRRRAWVAATAVGLMVGLVLATWLVDYRTDLSALALQGAVTGAVVGAAQATLLLPRLGRIAVGWPVVLAGAWTVGWVVTTSGGIDVDQQFTVFGAEGAIVVALLTSVLPVLLRHTEKTPS
jgi:hypothetical protein